MRAMIVTAPVNVTDYTWTSLQALNEEIDVACQTIEHNGGTVLNIVLTVAACHTAGYRHYATITYQE